MPCSLTLKHLWSIDLSESGAANQTMTSNVMSHCWHLVLSSICYATCIDAGQNGRGRMLMLLLKLG